MHSAFKCVAVAYYIATDALVGFIRSLGFTGFGSGRRHARYTPEQSADYISGYIDSFQRKLGKDAFHGEVCEIGPGDSLGGGVLMRARGARSVTYFERFQGRENRAREKQVARLVLEREEIPLNSALQSNFALPSIDQILDEFRVINGEAEVHLLSDPTCFDLIISNSVLQHTRDPLTLLQRCYDRLKPGGYMLHVIDLRNLGMMKRWGELAWLETSNATHHRMTQHLGRPNRVRFGDYSAWAQDCGGEGSIGIRHVVGSREHFGDCPSSEVPAEAWTEAKRIIELARPRFPQSIQGMVASDLAVAAFTLCVTKSEAD